MAEIERELERQFHEEMLSLYKLSGRELGYWPHYFLRDVKKYGGLATVKNLLSKKLTSGFTKVQEKQRLDLAVESYVLNPNWQPLFTEEELAIARQRLEKLEEGVKGKATVTAYVEFDPEAGLYVGI
ncbi:MAG: hypothetical protein M3Z23_03370, partial [Acidobacteriota bacterium]|nr:hypothetical protein [Acidobacteriota bacterium]